MNNKTFLYDKEKNEINVIFCFLYNRERERKKKIPCKLKIKFINNSKKLNSISINEKNDRGCNSRRFFLNFF